MIQRFRYRAIACGALAVLVAFSGFLANGPATAGETRVPASKQEVTLTFAPVVKRVSPAVVNIYTKRVVEDRRSSPFMFNDPLFKRFFGEDFGFRSLPRERVQNSLGSGVIIRSDGIVVTNNHVVEGSEEITVVLHDRREYDAELVGSDPRTDLAVLKLTDFTGEALPTLSLGDSDALEVGDLVLAVGNPFGVGQTVTSGIVSALARTSVGVTDYRSFIQTDAAINPGNSGGALVTSAGELIGVNTAIYSRDGGSVGIGFAIPANMVRRVVDGILDQGRPVRAWLGATGQEVTSDIAASLGMDVPRGVLVGKLSPEGPAAKAGLRVGDVIVQLNGREVNDVQGLRYRIATLPVGGMADLNMLRDGRPMKTTVELTPPPDKPPRNETVLEGRHPLAGATVANVNPALAEELGLGSEEPGVIILEIVAGSYAARMRLRPGDRILKVNDLSVEAVRDLLRAVAGPQPRWYMSILRDGRVLNLSVRG